MLLGCLKTLQRPYQILDWYWALAFLWQNNNIAKCADGRDGKPHSKGSKFLVSKCLHCFSPDWLEKPPHSSHFPKCYRQRHQKPFVRQMSFRSWEKVAVNMVLDHHHRDGLQLLIMNNDSNFHTFILGSERSSETLNKTVTSRRSHDCMSDETEFAEIFQDAH